MILRKARKGDLEAICELYQTVSENMEAGGIGQWRWGEYPSRALVEQDIANDSLYCLYGQHGMVVAVTVETASDEAFGEVDWLFGVRPGVFHRLCVHPSMRASGYGRQAEADVEEILRGLGCDSLRCDTGADNTRVRGFYESLGMRMAGIVPFRNRPAEFVGYEKRLTEDCPLLPLVMKPAFRGGSLTPWGGEKLRTVFGKDIREVPTGESLEVSCIPGLESTDLAGVPLPELIRLYGGAFAGRYEFGAFPLLLKLIDAREPLSVQVHPNNAYAHDNEGGKLGKTEAWLILDAPEGSELVYGIRPGTTLEELRAACEQGAAVEPLLRRVAVRPGDVCFIPAGCVHAIGAGITLYEIQQSSDITYRFYDWDRVDAKGNRRELHLAKALDVTDLDFHPDPVPAPDAPCARVLDTEYFTLDLFNVDGREALPPVNHFGMLTALDDGLTLFWEGWKGAWHELKKGETLFVPAAAPALSVRGKGRACLSMPK